MAVLGKRFVAMAPFGAAVAALAGCVVLRELVAPVRKFAFSHRQHVRVEKLECANCHADALAKNEPGMPAPDTCESPFVFKCSRAMTERVRCTSGSGFECVAQPIGILFYRYDLG